MSENIKRLVVSRKSGEGIRMYAPDGTQLLHLVPYGFTGNARLLFEADESIRVLRDELDPRQQRPPEPGRAA